MTLLHMPGQGAGRALGCRARGESFSAAFKTPASPPAWQGCAAYARAVSFEGRKKMSKRPTIYLLGSS